MQLRKEWKEAAVCAAIIAVSALVYWDSLKLPPGGYDPLGGGTMPRIVCVTIIVLTLAALAQTMIPALLRGSVAEPQAAPAYDQRPGLAAMIFGLLMLYTLSIQLKVPFALSTSAFLFVSTMFLGGLSLRKVPSALVIGIVVGFTLNYLFTSVFRVDLP